MSQPSLPRLPEDIEDLLAEERSRPAESRATRSTVERLREHLQVTLGPAVLAASPAPAASECSPPNALPHRFWQAIRQAIKSYPLLVTATAFASGLGIGAALNSLRDTRPQNEVTTVAPTPLVAPAVSQAQPSAPDETRKAEPLPTISAQVVAKPIAPKPNEHGSDPSSAERTALDIARTAAARGQNDEALAALSRHAQRFPNGSLAEEREGLRIQILARTGRTAEATDAARRFRARYPMSLMLPAIDEVLRRAENRSEEP